MSKDDTQQLPRQTTQQLPKTLVVRHSRRAAFAIVGGVLIALGLALIWLPGPFTIPLVVLGLLVLSREFGWAKRLLLRIRSRVQKAKSDRGRRHAR